MQRKIINGLPEYAESKAYAPLKATISKVIQRLQEIEKDKAPPNKEQYASTLKDMSWAIGSYCNPHWPDEVEEIISRLKTQVDNFENLLIRAANQKKGSFFICGSDKQKSVNLEPVYQRILSYQHVFHIIGIYQNKKIKEDIVYNVMDFLEKNHALDKNEKSEVTHKQIKQQSSKLSSTVKDGSMCRYCQLMKSISVCPNGYIAKKLLRELPDVEWVGGILHEEGKIVDKDLEKAISYYEKGLKKKNPEALYRLGLLNERGDYGKPLQYLKMWEQAANMGHLESMTDLGYLYENGLENEETGLNIIHPNSEKALSYYSKAVEQNFPRALNNLASFYYNDSKYKNSKKCLQYFERAAEAEYVKSLYNLGIIYFQGDLGIQDEDKYKQLIKRSADKGDIQGKQQYIEIMLNEAGNGNCSEDDLTQMNLFCRQIIAEEEDNPYAYYFFGIMYESGYGVPQEPKTAFLYYSKATRYPCPEAYIKMGFCYKNGFGVQQSSKDAIKYFKSAVPSLPQALIYIGQMYEKGYPDLKQNFEQAFNHYYDACNQKIPEAFTHLGYMYQNGRHVKRDEKKAEEYFAKGKSLVKKPTFKLGSSSELIQSSYFRSKK